MEQSAMHLPLFTTLMQRTFLHIFFKKEIVFFLFFFLISSVRKCDIKD